jgi:lipoate-protein ligase A
MRRGGGLLQHGSILIEPRIARLTTCLRLPDSGGSREIGDGVAGLAELGVTDPAQVAAAIGDAFAARFGVSLVETTLNRDEAEVAGALAGSKYRSAGWTERLAPALA